jgi:hypothetical protein
VKARRAVFVGRVDAVDGGAMQVHVVAGASLLRSRGSLPRPSRRAGTKQAAKPLQIV